MIPIANFYSDIIHLFVDVDVKRLTMNHVFVVANITTEGQKVITVCKVDRDKSVTNRDEVELYFMRDNISANKVHDEPFLELLSLGTTENFIGEIN